MYESYLPIPNTELVPISDTTVERNSLGYLILRTGAEDSPNTKIDIPAVVKLYDFLKFKEIIDTEFAEIFPNNQSPTILEDLSSQLSLAQTQLSGSQVQIDQLNTIIDGLQTPPNELELWRTRKTFKRIVEGGEFLYPLGFPTINGWTDAQWGEFAAAIIKVYTNLTPEEDALVQDFLTGIEDLRNQLPPETIPPTIYPVGSTGHYLLRLANFINAEAIAGLNPLFPPGGGYNPNPSVTTVNSQTIVNLQNYNNAGFVSEINIDSLTSTDVPNVYQQFVTQNPNNGVGSSTGWGINSVNDFKTLCKRIVFWNNNLSNLPSAIYSNGFPSSPNQQYPIYLLGNHTVSAVEEQLNLIQGLETYVIGSRLVDSNSLPGIISPFNVNTYYESIP